MHVASCRFLAGVDVEDERTGIAEGGWREEKAEAKTQLNKDMENESGKSPNVKLANLITLLSPDSSSPLSLDDSELLTGLLETIVVLWEAVRERIDKPGNKQLKKKLVTTISSSLPQLFDTFKVYAIK